jgi:prepilin-type N-terminal cleavage/methylation domain-containing protein
MPTAHRRAPAAFTLIEVMVALAVGGILLSTVVGLLTLTMRDARRMRAQAEMLRDAESIGRLLGSELRLAGLGVPRGEGVDPSYGTSPPVTFPTAVLVAGDSEVGILADLPRPDANFSTFGALHTRPTGTAAVRAIAWHNENNGACIPDGSATSCVVGRDSLLFPDGGAGCRGTGSGAAFADRQCPWGLRRVLPGDSILIVAGDGRWSRALVSGSVVTSNVASGGPVAAELSAGYPTAVWPNTNLGDAPGGALGQGFVTTLDRVFYKLDGRTLVRRQCWGDPNPDDPDWPALGTNTVPATPQSTAGSNANDTVCTPAEVVARSVDSLTFTYLDADNLAVTVGPTTKADIRRIDYDVRFSRTVDGRPVQHGVTGVVRLLNIQ